jgi:large subunit ribosomal protein L7/L12
MEKIEKLLEEIDSLTVIELSELVKGIEEKYGVSAAAVAAPAAGAAGAAAVTPYFSSIPLTNSDSSTTVKLSISSNILSVFSLIFKISFLFIFFLFLII